MPPVPENDRIPVDLRRNTLIVRDIDRSIAFYGDALGLTTVYDEKLLAAESAGRPNDLRLVLMRANDTFIGAIGLIQYFGKPDPGPVRYSKPEVGSVILVFNVLDLDERFPRVSRTPGVRIETEPKLIEYPAPGGRKISVRVSTLWDPDGYYVELNQILGTPAGA